MSAAAAKIQPPLYTIPGNLFGGEGSVVTLINGFNAPDGKGNVTAYATYRQNNAILENHRDFSACRLASNATGFN
jgi:iron complex outermembrane receptor protein